MNHREKLLNIPKMNSTNLYATTTNIILQADPKNPNTWQDLYRLVPYLRNSLCCVVCSALLVDPYTPANAGCQHHVCYSCRGGRKRIKPACESCKDCMDYTENKRLRILLQCYKQMCVTLMSLDIFKVISYQAREPCTGFERGASNLIALIKEGASFQDDYKSNGGLPKAAYSILPCVYTNLSTISPSYSTTSRTLSAPKESRSECVKPPAPSKTSFYSVVYPGTGNKITLKRKPKETTFAVPKVPAFYKSKGTVEKPLFKKPGPVKPKKGCRCGNATATPGKLTCCGQRCPCYVDSKPCSECRCRGCRNPHRMDGLKVMPRIIDIQKIHLVTPQSQSRMPPPLQPQFRAQVTPKAQLQPPPQIKLPPSSPPPLQTHIPDQVPEILETTDIDYGSLELETQFSTVYDSFPIQINQQYEACKGPEVTTVTLL